MQSDEREDSLFDWAALVLFEVTDSHRSDEHGYLYERDVFTHDPQGNLEGVRAASLVSCNGHTLFGRPLTSAYVHPDIQEGPYRATIAIVPFQHRWGD